MDVTGIIDRVSNQPEPPTSAVTVLPGVPNMARLTVDDGVVPFPDTTVDFVKILRERGIVVEYAVPREDRRYVGHKAYELWLPILEFSMDVLAGLEAGILVELVKTYLDPPSGSAPTPDQISKGRKRPTSWLKRRPRQRSCTSSGESSGPTEARSRSSRTGARVTSWRPWDSSSGMSETSRGQDLLISGSRRFGVAVRLVGPGARRRKRQPPSRTRSASSAPR